MRLPTPLAKIPIYPPFSFFKFLKHALVAFTRHNTPLGKDFKNSKLEKNDYQ